MPRGRPNGSKNLVAEIEGWHGEPVEAKLRGVTVTQLRRHARDGVGPMPVKIGQHVYYKDGDLAGCGKSRDFGKTVMKRARNGNLGLIKSTGYEGAKGDELGWKHHRPTFSAAC